MGLGMVEIRACSDFDFFFFLTFFKHTFYLARFSPDWVTARGMTYKQQKSQIALAKGEKKKLLQPKQTFSQFEVYLISVHINLPH